MANRTLHAYIFSDIAGSREGVSIRAMAIAATTSLNMLPFPVVIVVTDESGKELRRSSFGKVSDELRDRVNKQFPIK